MNNPRTKFWKFTFKSQDEHNTFMEIAANNDSYQIQNSSMEKLSGKFILSLQLKDKKYKNQLLKGVKGIYVDIQPDKKRIHYDNDTEPLLPMGDGLKL